MRNVKENVKMKELDRKSLTIEQKLGQLLCATLAYGEEDVQYALSLIRNHALGAIWVQPDYHPNALDTIRRVREAADYPILIMTDAENGFGEHKIPAAIAIAAAHKSEEVAHSFGRLTGTLYRKMGYNTVCNPIIDVSGEHNAPCGSKTRNFGADKERTARLGAAVARGMHEAGIMTVGKHYPFGGKGMPYDSHMREGYNYSTKEELIEGPMYPCLQLMKEGLLDGIMVGHKRCVNIDPERPSSLSKPMLDIIREKGFNGFIITDALNMMGIVLKYGYTDPIGMSVAAGCDIPLPWGTKTKPSYEGLLECYKKGILTDADVEAALDRVLEAQHKAALLPEPGEILPEDAENIRRLHRDCIAARCAEGLSPSIDPNGKHLFTIVTDERIAEPDVDYTPGPRAWFFPYKIAARIKELFPNSEVTTIPVYPTSNSNIPYFDKQTKFDDIVFITNYQTAAYTGREHLTTRVVDLMDALQSTDRIVAHLHFGNPFVAADAPYVPRILLGHTSEKCVMHGLEILAGNEPALGTVPYEIEWHKKGEFLGY